LAALRRESRIATNFPFPRTLGTTAAQGPGRQQVGPHLTVAGAAGGPVRIALFEQGVMLAALEGDVLPGVASTTGLGEISPVDRTGRVAAIQNAAVGRKRLEGGGIAAMALLTSHIVAPVGRAIPLVEMSGGVWIREMTIGTTALLRRCGNGSHHKRYS